VIVEYARAIFATLIVAAASFGIGTPLLPILPRSIPSYQRYIYSWLAGFGLLGVALFVIGQWRFSPTIIYLALATGIVCGAVHLARASKRALPRTNDAPDTPNSASFAGPGHMRLAATVVGVVLAITAVAGLAAPTGDWNNDEISYHLVGSKVWLRDGVIRPILDNGPSSYPCDVEVMFAALAAVGGERGPSFSPVFTIPLFLAVAAILGVRCGLRPADAWWVAALIAAMPAVYTGGHSGFIDDIYAAYLLAAIRIGLDAKRLTEFAAFGVFCGLMIATKYPGLVALPILVVCAAWPSRSSTAPNDKTKINSQTRTNTLRYSCAAAAVACAVACAIGSPYYLRNWILLGSPIYPPPALAARFLHPKYFSADASRAFYNFSLARGSGYGRGLLALLSLPFNFTYHTADFNGAGGIGLASLAFAPIGVVASWRDPFARRLAIATALLTLAWFFTLQESRYFIHVVAISAVFAVVGWSYALSLRRRIGAALCATVVACSLAYGLFMIVNAREDDIHAALSPSYAAQRRQRDVPFVQSMDRINGDPSVTRVLILDRTVMTYYLTKDYVKPFGQWWNQIFPDAPDSAAVLRKLPSLHVSHVLDVNSPIAPFQVPPGYPGLTLVFASPNQRLYRFNATSPEQIR
jgi:hypothetical protein